MAHRNKKKASQVALHEFVTVAFAEDLDLAKHYKQLLNEHEIPAAVKTQQDPDSTYLGIAVLVPEDNLDEAHHLIEMENVGQDFFEMVFGNPEDDFSHENIEDDQF